MSEQHSRRHPSSFWSAVLLPLLGGALLSAGANGREPEETRVPAGKSLSPAGTLLTRTAPGKPWEMVEPEGVVHSRDLLLAMPLSRAKVVSKNGAVQLLFWGNLPQLSEFPILETGVILHDSKSHDLEFTLQRGRVVVTNQKEKGAATVRVRMGQAAWELTLNEPGSEAALELFGRWPRGVPFLTDPQSGESPTLDLVLLVLKGTVNLQSATRSHALTAPPGPAYFHWDSAAGDDPGPQRREKLPEWKTRDVLSTPQGKAALSVVTDIAKRYQETKDPGKVVAGLLRESATESDPLRAGSMRRGLVYTMAALDLLDELTDALGHSHAEVRDTAVVALRHWIGRGPGQDLKLYDFLQKSKRFSPAHAEIVLHLLHSYGDVDLEKPETFEALIAYLRHPRPAVRQLASWHLYRLVPSGKEIAYDPIGPESDRENAFKQWKKLVPTGKLPSPDK
jgi:hypothetical protein